MCPIPSAPDPSDAAFTARFRGVADAAAAVDGYRPFNEQALLDLAAGVRTPLLIVAGTDPAGTVLSSAPGGSEHAVGAALLGRGELDLVIHPEHRRRGHGGRALRALLTDSPADLTAWSHGDHPGARALAAHHGFEAVRTLLELRMPLRPAEAPAAARPEEADPARPGTIDAFRPGADDAEWLALNALVFAGHPEQGALTGADLTARRAEPWFDAGDFLVIRDPDGRMVGYNWLKVEADLGEVYVIGIHPDAAGRGLGRRLMLAGLARLRERGCTAAALYVEADNEPAVHLYRALGFTDHTVDVQYRRMPG